MSLFSVTQPNDLKIRAKNIYGEKFFTKNPGDDTWIPLEPGGSEVTLPYYIQSDEIDMGGVVIQPSGITLGDDSGNEVVDASFVRGVSSLDTRVGTVETSTTALQTKMTEYIRNVGSITIKSPIDNCKLNLDRFGLTVYNTTNLINPTPPQIRIGYDTFTIWIPGDVVQFDFTKFKNLNKLLSVTSSILNDSMNILKPLTLSGTNYTDTVNKKMVVLDNTTKVVSYTDIPSSGGSVPYYIQPTKINIEDRTDPVNTSAVIVDGKGLTIRSYIDTPSPVNGSYISMQNSEIKLARYGAGDLQKTILKKLSIEFYNDVATPAVLNYTNLKRLLDYSPKKETKWATPNYATMGGTAPSAITGTPPKVSGFNKALHFFEEIYKPGDVLWINLAAWASGVGTDNNTARGIFVSCKAFEYSENLTWNVTYSKNNVTVSTQNVYVSNTPGEVERNSCFISFKSTSGTQTIDGWVRLELTGTSSKTPEYPGIGFATPTSAVQP